MSLRLTETPGDMFLAYSDGKIIRCNTDGGDTVTIYKSPDGYGFIQSMAIDTAGGKLYWVDEDYQFAEMVLLRANLDGTSREVVFNFGISNTYGIPRAITLDLLNQKVYLIAKKHNIAGADIMRVSLDGGALESVFRIEEWNPDNIGGENALKLDLVNNKIYFIEEDQDALYRLDLNPVTGSVANLTELFTGEFSRLFDLNLDLSNDKIYIADGPNIKVGKLDGTGSLTTMISRPGNISSFSIDLGIPKLFHTEGFPGLNKVNLDGGNTEVIEGLPTYPRTVLVAGEQVAHKLVTPAFSIQGLTDITEGTNEGSCEASFPIPSPLVSGAQGEVSFTTSLGIQPGESYTFPIGDTEIIYEATDDGSSLVITDTILVTVVDDEKPIINCVEDIIIEAEEGTSSIVVNYEDPTFSDNCPGAELSLLNGLASGSSFPVGSSRVSYQVVDAAGNRDTCGFTVLVKNGDEPISYPPLLFWTDEDAPGVFSSNLDGSSVRKLHTGDRPYSVHANPVTGKLYWTDRRERGIHIANLDGTEKTTILTNVTISYPGSINLDLERGKIYFLASYYETGPAIMRVNFDGTGLEVVTRYLNLANNLNGPRTCQIDFENNHLYFDNTSPGRICRVDLDPVAGTVSNYTELFVGELDYPTDFNLDVPDNKIYVEDGEEMKIGNLDGTGEWQSIPLQLSLYTLSIDHESERAYYYSYVADELRRVDLDGQNDTLIQSGLTQLSDISNTGEYTGPTILPPLEDHTSLQISFSGNLPDTLSYQFTGDAEIGTFKLAKEENKKFSNLEEGTYQIAQDSKAGYRLDSIIITGDIDNGSQINLASRSVEIDLDEGEEIEVDFVMEEVGMPMEIFWTNTSSRTVVKGNLEDKSFGYIVINEPRVYGLVADSIEGKVYWATSDHIYRSNLDGTEAERLLGNPSGVYLLYRLALDLVYKKIYFIAVSSSTNKEGIFRSNLDGTNLELLSTFEDLGPDLTNSKSIQVDPLNNHLYFSQTSPANVYRLDLNPLNGTLSNLTNLFPNQVGLPFDLGLDLNSNQLFIADIDKEGILVGNLDGTGTLYRLATEYEPLKISMDIPNQRIYYLDNISRGKICAISLDGQVDEVLFDLTSNLNDITSVHESITADID
ncbi:MAG: HYR domain-containing protein, partial [Bacteroidota bacterium]